MILMWQSLSALSNNYHSVGELRERQARWLLVCLKRNRLSDYGRQFCFSDIHCIEDYRASVPLISYESIQPWLERVANGEANVLFDGLPVGFERTGGSSGGSKLIPYSSHSLLDFRAAVLPWLADAIALYGLGSGRVYLAISPATRQTEQTAGGIAIGLADGAYLGDAAGYALSELSAVPLWVAMITNVTEWQLVTLYWLVRCESLELISVWSPTFFLTIMDGLEQRFTELDALLHQGGTLFQQNLPPDAAARSRLACYIKSKDACLLWTNLKLVSCWQDGASKPFFNELQRRLSHAAFQNKGLLATEGVVTVPSGKYPPVLAVDSGFFEFLDDAGQCWFAHELVCGSKYEVIMTSSGGLYRYRTGDCVRYESNTNGLPVLRFLGRSGLVSDLVGEKLTEEFVAACLDGIVGFHLLVPCIKTKPHYVLVLDIDSDNPIENLKTVIEDKLAKNPQYAYARCIGQLDKLTLCLVHHPLAAYTQRVMQNGARLGDIKLPALRPETDWLATFLEVSL